MYVWNQIVYVQKQFGFKRRSLNWKWGQDRGGVEVVRSRWCCNKCKCKEAGILMSPSGLTPPMDRHFHLCPCPANSPGYFVTHHWWTVTRLKRGSPLQNENSCRFLFTLICSNPPTHMYASVYGGAMPIRSRLLPRLPQHSTTVWEGFKVNGTVLIGCTVVHETGFELARSL